MLDESTMLPSLGLDFVSAQLSSTVHIVGGGRITMNLSLVVGALLVDAMRVLPLLHRYCDCFSCKPLWTSSH
jgi:hypothetical protein